MSTEQASSRGAEYAPLRHAVFPVAGFGADFLPATKACPKELFPIVDRPLIQFAVEETAAAGFTHMIFVTGHAKRAIEDHFDYAYELERELAAQGRSEALRALHAAVPRGVSFSHVRQPDATGVLDALRRARPLLGDEPFAVVIPDQLIDAKRPALAQLVEVFAEQQRSVVGAERLRSLDGQAGGTPARLIAAALDASAIISERSLVKVPPIGAESLPITPLGRYIFTPSVWAAIERASDGGPQDDGLTRTVRALMERERVFACLIEGQRFDCGSQLGFLEAQLAYAQKSETLWNGLCRRVPELRRRPSLRRRAVATAGIDGDRPGERASRNR